MFELIKSFRFEAGHTLCHHDGYCSSPHGHSYVLDVHLSSKTLQTSGPQTNMVVDFQEIKKVVKPMISEYLDHKWLNDTLMTDSPTAEFIARWIFEYLAPNLPFLSAITIHETALAKVTYRLPSEN